MVDPGGKKYKPAEPFADMASETIAHEGA